MGSDKSSLLVNGDELGAKLAKLLRDTAWEPTILGRKPIPGFAFQEDRKPLDGPMVAIADYQPPDGLVFVLSCDVPRFDCGVPNALASCLENFDAVVPMVNGRLQPLCAVYRSSSWDVLKSDNPPHRIMDWLNQFSFLEVDEQRLNDLGLPPSSVQGANTPEELSALLAEDTPANS